MLLSIIIPAYNEERRLAASLERIAQYLVTRPYQTELLIVNDGSTDNTTAVANSYIERFHSDGIALKVLENPGNRGKGYSVRHGMLAARGEIAVFTDADLSAPITEIDRLIEPIIAGDYDVVFGSRGMRDSVISTHQPWSREFAGRTFNFIMQVITGLPYQDTQCGFKAFAMPATRVIFEQQRINGFGFDVELLFIANKHQFRLLELPVVWGDVAGSTVNLSRGLRAFYELGVIRWNDLCRRYPQTVSPATVDAITMR